jgi:hypothetical protein
VTSSGVFQYDATMPSFSAPAPTGAGATAGGFVVASVCCAAPPPHAPEQAGIQILVADHYAIDLAGGFNQVGIKYEAEMGSQAQLRGVTGSTDRSYGVNATLGVLY